MKKLHTCCFIGHRKINETDELKKNLQEIIENMIINENVDTFLFGSKSSFDKLCLKTVTELKEKHPHIKRIYVRAEYYYINDDYKDYLLEHYDDTYYPEHIKNAGKSVYVERNYEIIDSSHFCVFYFNEDYIPPKRKNSVKDLNYYQPKSGTKLAYEYAVKNSKIILNIFKNEKSCFADG